MACSSPRHELSLCILDSFRELILEGLRNFYFTVLLDSLLQLTVNFHLLLKYTTKLGYLSNSAMDDLITYHESTLVVSRALDLENLTVTLVVKVVDP